MTHHRAQHEYDGAGTRHGKGQAGSLAPQQKAGSSKGQSGLEAALQCEEHLADDVAAPSGTSKASKACKACKA